MDKIQSILNEVERIGKARTDFIQKTAQFAERVIETAMKATNNAKKLYLGKFEGAEFTVERAYSNVGYENYLFISDGEGKRAINEARLGGGYFYLHNDFNKKIEFANYADCVKFVSYMKNEFGANVEKSIKVIEERMSFFS